MRAEQPQHGGQALFRPPFHVVDLLHGLGNFETRPLHPLRQDFPPLEQGGVIPILGIIGACTVPEIQGAPENPDDVFLK